MRSKVFPNIGRTTRRLGRKGFLNTQLLVPSPSLMTAIPEASSPLGSSSTSSCLASLRTKGYGTRPRALRPKHRCTLPDVSPSQDRPPRRPVFAAQVSLPEKQVRHSDSRGCDARWSWPNGLAVGNPVRMQSRRRAAIPRAQLSMSTNGPQLPCLKRTLAVWSFVDSYNPSPILGVNAESQRNPQRSRNGNNRQTLPRPSARSPENPAEWGVADCSR